MVRFRKPAPPAIRRLGTGLRVAAILTLAAVAPATSAEPEDGLLYRWRFHPDAAEGQVIAAETGPLNATIEAPVEFSREAPEALVLSGDSAARSHVSVAVFDSDEPPTIADAQLPQTEITVEAWVRVDEAAEWGGFCGMVQDNGEYERGWILGYHRSNFFFAVSSESKRRLTYLTDPTSFQTGYWYHLAGVYDGRQLKIYVDGKLRAVSDEQSGPIAYPPSGFFTIGAYHDDNELHALNGRIEQVSVYEKSLSAETIAARFESRISEFPGIQAVPPQVADWPTYRRDNLRTGISPDRLTPPLSLAWVYRPRHPPQPAWPPPAKQNFWAEDFNLRPRVTYDRAFHVAAVGDSAYFASSADDKVTCLDAASGAKRWTFFAEAPVRLAPTIHNGRALFGSDDGRVYCLDAETGELQWTSRFEEVPERWIAGNGRIISSMPIRSGVLVDEGVVYFCTGLFPNQGVYQVAIDLQTGEFLNSGRVNASAQGYLERRSGQLYVRTGRDPAGVFTSQLKRRGKDVGHDVADLSEEYPYAFIGAEDVRIGGGDGKVTAFAVDDGRPVWTADVDGNAYGLALARGRLFVSTDQGSIYCFTPEKSSAQEVKPETQTVSPFPSEEVGNRYAELAQRILTHSETSKGYCLMLGGEGYLALELARQSEFKIVVVEADADKVAAARDLLDRAGFYGRVVVHHRSPEAGLPYTDYLFNLVVGDSLAAGGRIPGDEQEIRRVLRPGGGVALLTMNDADVIRREPMDGIGEWSHMYANPANTVCSGDQRVQGRMAMQWFGRPGPRDLIDRHLRTVAPLWKDGRLFIPGDDRIFAVDAYNGTPLWTVELPDSRRVAAFRDCSYMAAGDGSLYVAVDDRCLVINAATGYTEQTFRVPGVENGEDRDWGYVASVEDLLLGSGVKPGASRRTQNLETIHEAAYYDFRESVTSDFLYAYNRQAADHAWTYASEQGAILNPTITIGGGRVYFVESHNSATLSNATGRSKITDLLGNGADLVALDLHSGNVLWRIGGAFTAAEHNLYAAFAGEKLVVVGSRNGVNDEGQPRVLFDVHVHEAADGKPVWNTTQIQPTEIGGSHGEQDLHPVIVGETLYCEPFAYHLPTGEPQKWGWSLGPRRGCGTISASASTFFFRHNNPTMFDLTTGLQSPVTTSTRPGCWVNIIPAGGLLLIPEASSGCTCNFAVQTSMAFLPVP